MFYLIISLVAIIIVAYIWTARTRGALRYAGSLTKSSFIYIHGARLAVLEASVEDADAAEVFRSVLDENLVDSKEYRKSSVKFAKTSRDALAAARALATKA